MYYPDHHVHCHFSPDSTTPPEAQIERAIELGMPAICFTDHMDYDYPKEVGITFDLRPEIYLPAIAKLRDQYAGQIDVRAGVEIGLDTYCPNKIVSYIQSADWDFVIGSIHLAGGRKDPYLPSYFEGRTAAEAYRAYFEDTLKCLQTFPPIYDVFGHLDYVFRCGDRSITNAWKEWPDLIDEILRQIVQQGLGLDVNTGGMKNGLPMQHPHDDILRRYRELGGELITLGSDGHKTIHLGDHFPEVGEKLKALGFQYAASYKARKPEFYSL
ncbi:MAG: histidinol-phosphatase HisJ family protein [Lachnospiraceae bacterium]|nr:histidinol-phosphatase HisJ family protein [Lachnospiraceae bacterium]